MKDQSLCIKVWHLHLQGQLFMEDSAWAFMNPLSMPVILLLAPPMF